LGCDFVDKDCNQWQDAYGNILPGFCNAPSQSVGCNYDRRGYGYCNIISNYKNIPAYYQHWGSPSIGGQSVLADYCGYVGQEGLTTWCNIGATSVQQVSDYTNILGSADYGEVFSRTSRCYTTTLARINTPIELESFTSVIPPGIQSSRCYNTTCAGPQDLRIQVDEVWYQCSDQTINVIGYGGSLTCPPALQICVGAAVDNTWPTLTSIFPTSGNPSTRITITGTNFNTALYNYTVIMEVECTDVQVIDNQTIAATIPGGDHFVSVADLAIFKTKKHIVVRDSRGYTAHMFNAFEIHVEFDAEYLRNLFNWMSANPLWALLIWTIILLPFFCACCIIYKCCCKKIKKPKRSAHHEYAKERDYYDDDYEVDDYYDVDPNVKGHRQGPSIAGGHGQVAGGKGGHHQPSIVHPAHQDNHQQPSIVHPSHQDNPQHPPSIVHSLHQDSNGPSIIQSLTDSGPSTAPQPQNPTGKKHSDPDTAIYFDDPYEKWT